MRSLLGCLAVAGALLLWASPGSAQPVRPPGPQVGAPAPDFQLKDTAGKRTVQLSGYRGKTPVVLIFASYT